MSTVTRGLPAGGRPLTSVFRESTPQQKFNLAVQAAQLIVCPALNGVEHLFIDSKQERLSVRHGAY
jgi:hypothetical protein